jgi:hypothetical protein
MLEWFLLIIGVILFLIFSRARFRIPGLSSLSLFLAILIFVAATILFNQIWADVTDLVRPEGTSYYYRSDREFLSIKLNELLAHTLYVIPLLVLAIILYVTLEKKGVRYRVVTFPYFAAAGITMIRLLIDVGAFAIERYEKGGIYGVLIIVLVVLSALIFYIQKKWEERKKEDTTPQVP